MWLPSTIQMASEQHITVLVHYPITLLHNWIVIYIQLWHLFIQIVRWYSSSISNCFYSAGNWATVRMHPCTLKLLHIHVQHVYLSTKGTFQLLQFWEKGWGETTKKQTPQFLRRGTVSAVIQLNWKIVHISFLWTKLWTRPRIFKPKWSKVSC